MKRIPWYGWVGLAGGLLLALEVLAFGGVQRLGEAGRAAAEQARREQPVTHTYMVLGRQLLSLAPALDAAARAVARASWGKQLPAMRAQPLTAADRLADGGAGLLYGMVRFGFWAAPLLLLLAFVGRLRRPHKVSLIGPGVRR